MRGILWKNDVESANNAAPSTCPQSRPQSLQKNQVLMPHLMKWHKNQIFILVMWETKIESTWWMVAPAAEKERCCCYTCHIHIYLFNMYVYRCDAAKQKYASFGWTKLIKFLDAWQVLPNWPKVKSSSTSLPLSLTLLLSRFLCVNILQALELCRKRISRLSKNTILRIWHLAYCRVEHLDTHSNKINKIKRIAWRFRLCFCLFSLLLLLLLVLLLLLCLLCYSPDRKPILWLNLNRHFTLVLMPFYERLLCEVRTRQPPAVSCKRGRRGGRGAGRMWGVQSWALMIVKNVARWRFIGK